MQSVPSAGIARSENTACARARRARYEQSWRAARSARVRMSASGQWGLRPRVVGRLLGGQPCDLEDGLGRQGAARDLFVRVRSAIARMGCSFHRGIITRIGN